MKVKKSGNKTKITFSYFEWISAGKTLPQPMDFTIDGVIEYTINEVPQDKEDFFKKLGWNVVLAISKGQGMRRW